MRHGAMRPVLILASLTLAAGLTGTRSIAAGVPERPGARHSDPPAPQEPSQALISLGDGRWRADNDTQRIQVLFSEEGARILPESLGQRDWEWGISLTRLGGPDDPRAPGRPILVATTDGVEYLRGPVVESFRNGPAGIEHELEIQGPEESPILRFDFILSGTLTPKVSEDGQTVIFRDASGAAVLSYLDLRGLDAEGREASAHWERIEPADDSGAALRLVLQGADHAFPLRVLGRLATTKGAPRSMTTLLPTTGTTTLAAPSNDLCGAAELIPGGGPFPYLSSVVDITDAGTVGDPPSPSCQSSVSRSVWYTFTPASTGAYTFSVCSDAPTATTVEDTVLSLYFATGTCTGLAEVSGGCDDDTCGAGALQSAIANINLTAGTTYYIVAWSYGTAAPLPGAGSLQLRVVRNAPPGPAPPNDRCDGAELIPGGGPFPYSTSITADLSSATTTGDPPAPSCQPNVSRSIWYSFTPAVGGRYTFSVCADETMGTTVDDTVMAIYAATAACSGFLEVPAGCDDDSCASEAAQSRVTGISLAAGTRYYIVVWKYATAAPAAGNTAVQLRVGLGASPPNDACAAATTLALDTPISGTTVDALDDTRLPPGSSCFAGIGQTPSTAIGRDAVYRFTAPEGGRYSFRLSGYDPSGNAVLYVSSDCPAGAAPALVAACLGAANRSSAFPEEASCLPLDAGQTVYVYVDADTLISGSAFTIEANRCPMEREPNGDPPLAGEAACETEGSIAPASDADFFALGIPESGSRVFAMVDGAAGNSSDFDLRVTTETSTLEYDDFNNDSPFGSASPNVSGTALNGAASYLRVSHYSPLAQAEPYRLYAAVQPPASRATTELEPNNTPATATAGAQEYFSGTVSGSGDVDLFSLSAAAGELLQIGLDLNPLRDNTPFNGSLALLDASGGTILMVNDPASSSSNVTGAGSLTSTTPFSPGEAMFYRIRSAGTYYVKVAGSGGTGGDYLLSIARNGGVSPPTDLALTQGDSPDPVVVNGTVTYVLTVRNLGGSSASVVTVRDDLPPGFSLLSASPSQGTCASGSPAVCHLGTIAAGGKATVEIRANAPPAAGAVTNSARVASAVLDRALGNNTVTEMTTVASGADSDGDGAPDASDCAPANAALWAVPGEAERLVFPTLTDRRLLLWEPPQSRGGTSVLYDLLRSTTPASFAIPTCIVKDAAGTSAADPVVPARIFHYLVRSKNACGGNLGSRSDGTPRTGGICP